MSTPRSDRLNLLPAWRVVRRRVHRRMSVWAVVLAAYAAGLGVSALVVHGPGDEETLRLRAQADAARDEAERTQREHAQTMAALASKSRLLEASRTVGVHPDWSLLLEGLAELRGERVVLSSLDLKAVETQVTDAQNKSTRSSSSRGSSDGSGTSAPGKAASGKDGAGKTGADLGSKAAAPREAYTLRLTGMGATHSEVMAFVRRLEAQGPFKDVSVLDTRAQKAGAGELTRFEIECRLVAEEARE